MKKIVDWVTYKQLEEKQKEYNEYPEPFWYEDKHQNLKKYTQETEDFNQFYEDAIIKELIDNEYVICGDTHQYYAIPVFEDGYCLLSMRRWGEIMSEAWRLRGFNTRPNFYLASLCSIFDQEKLPSGCEIDG